MSIVATESMKISIYAALGLFMFSTSIAAAEVPRWYTAEQVSFGQQLFERKCARCHGENAEGQRDWRRSNPDGEYPPPPLDGNAYSTGYSLEQLRRHIQTGRQGKARKPSSFRDRLNDLETDAVIAFFQSKWSEKTYQAWQSKQVLSATRRFGIDQEPDQHSTTHWLKRHLSGAKLIPGEPMKTPVRGITEVRVNDDYLYLTEDGRYAFTGNLIDLKNGRNVTRLNRSIETRRLLEGYPAEHMIVYPAAGDEKTSLTIFTDTSCGFCRKMHRELPELRKRGVSVRFVPYPRRGVEGSAAEELVSIWCAENPAEALSKHFEGRDEPTSVGHCDRPGAVEAGYRLGNSLGITGTPLLILQNGERIRGYKTAAKVLSRIGLGDD